jgi:predicted amidohydrolase
MQRNIKLAAVQMRSTYGDVKANVQSAERLVSEAAMEGAKLVVLPEFFNSGYAYRDTNYSLVESPDGMTFRWMTKLAADLNIHLAGSIMIRKDGEIYNTLVLVAPDGRTWEYDKAHPWGWERAYFCAGRGTRIADTKLGKIGLMVCYDVAFPELFAAYAGKIQLLLISSCPPKVNRKTIHFPSGREVPMAETSPLARIIQESGDHLFDSDLRMQSSWLGVPLVNAMPYGDFASPVPRAKLSFGISAATNPRLWNLMGQADFATISAEYNQHTMIVDSGGEVLSRPSDGDSFALADVEIPAAPPQPSTAQPKMKLHPASRWVSSLLSSLVVGEYQRNR